MSTSAWALIGGLILFVGVALWSFRRGRAEAERDRLADSLDEIDQSLAVRRDVEREPDPVQRLRDDWSRPVLPDSDADPDR